MQRLISRICWNFMAARLPASQRMAQNTWLSCRKLFWNRWRLLSNWGIRSPFECSMSQDVNFHDPIKGQTPLMPEPRWWNLTFACHIAIFGRFTLHQLSTHKVWFVLEWLPVCFRLATMAGNVDLVEILLEERLLCSYFFISCPPFLDSKAKADPHIRERTESCTWWSFTLWIFHVFAVSKDGLHPVGSCAGDHAGVVEADPCNPNGWVLGVTSRMKIQISKIWLGALAVNALN